mgnify:CR=1 FL=1
MPAMDRVDPTLLDAVAARLARSSKATLEASHELLAHYADTGDTPTQRSVDALLDQVAAALGRLTDTLADAAKGLEASGRLAGTQGGGHLR